MLCATQQTKKEEEMEMLDYDAVMKENCIIPKWVGSLYKDEYDQYLILIPFPNFTVAARNYSLYQAVMEVNQTVEYAQEGKYQIAKRKQEEEYNVSY
jgi:FMN-dependent NADH-azoreductase